MIPEVDTQRHMLTCAQMLAGMPVYIHIYTKTHRMEYHESRINIMGYTQILIKKK